MIEMAVSYAQYHMVTGGGSPIRPRKVRVRRMIDIGESGVWNGQDNVTIGYTSYFFFINGHVAKPNGGAESRFHPDINGTTSTIRNITLVEEDEYGCRCFVEEGRISNTSGC